MIRRFKIGDREVGEGTPCFMIAEMARDVEAARLLTWHAAWMVDQGMNASKESAGAKLFATDTAMRAATDAVQTFGGNGYMREFPVEKLMRDARASLIEDGENNVLGLKAASILSAVYKNENGL